MERVQRHSLGVGDNVTFYECTMDFIATNGQPVHMEQVVGGEMEERQDRPRAVLLRHGDKKYRRRR